MTIENKQGYFQAMAEIESLLQIGLSNLTEEADARLDELTSAVESWENKAYPIPENPDFKSLLQYLMRTKGYNQTQLSSELHISKAFLSAILNGTREPNVQLLKSMHTNFNLDGNLLLESLH
ncbi:Antitoxin component HigA of the HigAB toxin-antitoxin module, contains an N-terminal HTH domain [Chitinophaga costaii]|uniref:Antitoxin component HigA of the HigAB toxin-antitoxin module, contains an N-terminal HTH domain n=2 Tax=Chitinophaga costaii TaxID=1335309 RepID=A0A1C4BVX3_9BACT|nr:Antitoxin component HigA of the HigAB toxin-antitoxin module, contains an N-terminal HTH domain [Chitinophaga costaii]